jgi:hypothetical protein
MVYNGLLFGVSLVYFGLLWFTLAYSVGLPGDGGHMYLILFYFISLYHFSFAFFFVVGHTCVFRFHYQTQQARDLVDTLRARAITTATTRAKLQLRASANIS